MKQITFIGPLPPPNSGTTVKNSILLQSLKSHLVTIAVISTTSGSVNIIGRLFHFLFSHNKYLLISVSSGGRRVLVPLAFLSKMIFKKRAVLLPCGGTLAYELLNMCKLQNWLYSKAYESLERIFVETNTMRVRLLEIIPNARVEVMYNFKPRPESLPHKRANNSVKVVFLSRMRRDKGIFILVDAIKKLKEMCLDVSLSFYGDFLPADIDDKRMFLDAIRQLEYVHWHGYIEPESINETLRSFDIFVFPTMCETEGFPGAIIDSAYAGLPVVVTDIAYNSELVEDNVTGLVCAPNDVSALADTIERLCRDSKLRLDLGRNNWNRSSEFDSNMAAERIASCFYPN